MSPVRCCCWLIVVALFVPAVGCSSAKRAEQIADKGKEQLFDGDRKQAISTLTKAIKTDPGCRKAYIFRGMCYAESNQVQKALRDYTKAIDLDPNDSYAYEQRAILYRTKLKDKAKAKADADKAAALRQGVRDEQRELYNSAR